MREWKRQRKQKKRRGRIAEGTKEAEKQDSGGNRRSGEKGKAEAEDD